MANKKADTAWWNPESQQQPSYGRSYNLSSQTITMRDGVRIAIDLYLPKDLNPSDQIPTIISQTRYYRRTLYNPPFGLIMKLTDPEEKMRQRFISHGYAFVMVGVRLEGFLRTWSDFNDALDANQLAPLARQKMGRLAGMAIRGVAPVDEDQDSRLLAQALADHGANYNVFKTVKTLEYRDSTAVNGIRFNQFSPHAFQQQIEESATPIYSWSSYFDGAYTLAAIKRFLNIKSPDNRLILGPWDHGGMQNPDPNSPGHKSYFDHAGEILRYFDAHLKGITSGIEKESPVHYYTMGEEAWKTAESWPPPNFTPIPFYLNAGGKLDSRPPVDEEGADTYQVDYSASSGLASRWVALVNIAQVKIGYPDRKEQDKKLLVYQTDPLTHPLELTGHPIITLYICSTADDGQFFVYLEDVTPQGDIHYVTEGIFRAIHRKVSEEAAAVQLPAGIPHHSFKETDAEPLVPGETAVLTFDLLPISYLFQKDHAIRIAVAGADRDNFEVLPPEPPTIELLRGRQNPSHILLPVQEWEMGQ